MRVWEALGARFSTLSPGRGGNPESRRVWAEGRRLTSTTLSPRDERVRQTGPGVDVQALSHVRLLATPQTVAHQAPLTMGLPRQGYWSRKPCPSAGALPHQGIKLVSPASARGFFTAKSPGEPAAWGASYNAAATIGNSLVAEMRQTAEAPVIITENTSFLTEDKETI